MKHIRIFIFNIFNSLITFYTVYLVLFVHFWSDTPTREKNRSDGRRDAA